MKAHDLAQLLLAGENSEVVLGVREDFESLTAGSNLSVTRDDGLTWIQAFER